LREPADPQALVPSLDAIVTIATDDAMPPEAGNDAIGLVRSVGMPQCLPALVGMIPHPHANPRFRYVAAQNALKCGATKAIKEVVRVLPEMAYEHRDMEGTISGEIANMSPRAEVLAALRELLGDKKWVVRWVAIEALAAMKSVEDAPRIAAMGKASDRLVGYWGEGSGKEDPTLGQRAKELSEKLGKGSK